MPESKITFADQPTIINGLPLTVSPAMSDALAAVHFGFTQAVEMYRVVTQPAQVPQQVVMPGFNDLEDEDTTGTLDMNSIWQMDPIAREAVLARHGLQTYQPPPPVVDPTHDILKEAIIEGGGIPPSEEE